MNSNLEVHSSHGYFDADPVTGRVTAWHPGEGADFDDACAIKEFDVVEYHAYCHRLGVDFPQSVDILLIGYWYDKGDGSGLQYEPPEPDARSTFESDREEVPSE